MTMIERVARAIAKREISTWTDDERGHQSVELLVNQTWRDWEDSARDALEEAKEPTANMITIGMVESARDDIDLTPEEIRGIWIAMIDAALQEGKETADVGTR